MPKAKKRKQPIVSDPNSNLNSSTAAQACRNVIRQYHVLLKRRKQLENDSQLHQQSLAHIDDQIKALGGLERYQQLSVLGQREERGGGSEKILINWMEELNLHHVYGAEHRLRLLEVGALKPDNFQSSSLWIDSMPIDLRSRHPNIIEQDFLLLDQKQHRHKWDAISLSLVLNFVPVPVDRGRMLQLAYRFLAPDGLLFLALPLPCVANSRYLTFDSLKRLLEAIGFMEKRARWRENGKMGYWLYQKTAVPKTLAHSFDKKVALRTGHRNNFAILLNEGARQEDHGP
ncbi:putative methyltransferase-domain-containing protein [Gymnopilus junonius]|uniref:25S rRNA adenine-N(1) methyltransferase n=1 Tax=Gymnopilus junonius TaxID=109634 RepID=A0A9P5TQU9_GYMJU|nr:putative methyltransferase-domain-containing protein [Gymnopilus junonius]